MPEKRSCDFYRKEVALPEKFSGQVIDNLFDALNFTHDLALFTGFNALSGIFSWAKTHYK